jgi:hypothetical protein
MFIVQATIVDVIKLYFFTDKEAKSTGVFILDKPLHPSVIFMGWIMALHSTNLKGLAAGKHFSVAALSLIRKCEKLLKAIVLPDELKRSFNVIATSNIWRVSKYSRSS